MFNTALFAQHTGAFADIGAIVMANVITGAARNRRAVIAIFRVRSKRTCEHVR